MNANGNNRDAVRSLFNLIDQTEHAENGTSPNLMGTFGVTNEVKCYMEEYNLPTGQLGVRLREKGSGRKVIIESRFPQDKVHFLNFLNAMGANKLMWPAILSKDDLSNSIVVSGKVKKSTTSKVYFRHDKDLTYQIQ